MPKQKTALNFVIYGDIYLASCYVYYITRGGKAIVIVIVIIGDDSNDRTC